MELYVKIRRAVMVEGRSEREVARYFGIGWNTLIRLYQPGKEILEGRWNFPEFELVENKTER